MSETATPRPHLARALRRAAIKLVIGLTVIWGTIFFVDRKMNQDTPPPAQAEASISP